MSGFLFYIGFGIAVALVFHGWPTFITIHKHYHIQDGDNSARTD